MSAQPQPDITEADYLQHERVSTTKHEYYAGEVVAMAGASEQHNLIAINLAALLRTSLRGSDCRTYPSDMRLKVVQTGLNTYPDFTIVCGPSQFAEPERRDALINSTLIIEILSPSTEAYNRGMKFQHYRTIDTLQDYVLVAQDKYYIERFTRQADGQWLFTDAIGHNASLLLPSVNTTLALREVYEAMRVVEDPSPLTDG